MSEWLKEIFRKFAAKMSDILGSAYAFLIAIILIVAWLLSGSVFNYSNTWQLIANTFTTLVTFLIGFLILNTAERSNKAQQIKLDEIIRAIDKAHNSLIAIENKPDKEIKQVSNVIHKHIKDVEEFKRECDN